MVVFSLMILATLACGAQASSPLLPSHGLQDETLEALWTRGVGMDAWLSRLESRRDVWEAQAAAARLPEDVARRMTALEGRGSWRLLVVAADWCLDSAHNVPPMARLAQYSDALELRLVTPGQGGQAVMDARHTSDGRAATPTVVILDERGNEVGCWIERPEHQRDFYLANMRGVEEGSDAWNAAVQRFLGWYREDNGASALRELVSLLEAAADGAQGCEPAGS